MQRTTPLLLLFFFGLTSNLYSQKTRKIEISIEPHLSFQYYEHFKRLVMSSPDCELEHLNGLDYKWGITQKVKVKETELAQSYSDGTRYTYELIAVISEEVEPASSTFLLTLDVNRYYYTLPEEEAEQAITLTAMNDSTYIYMDKVEIEVPQNLRPVVQMIAEGKFTKRARFSYVNEKRIRLIKFE